MVKKNASGLFFEKRAQSSSGKFFSQMPGRETGEFFGKQATTALPQPSPTTPSKPPVDKINIGATGGPTGGQGYRGEGMSGGMYGCGTGEKTASRTPNEWSHETDLPNGFHRPAKDQPEDLEAGGERFFDSEVEGPSYRSSDGMRHGVKEGGSMHMRPGSGHQIGKHASQAPRFLGTSFAKEAGYGSEFKSSLGKAKDEFVSSLGKAKEEAGEEASGALHSITKSPLAAAAITGLAGAALLRGGRRGYKTLKGAIKKTPAKKAPESLKDKARSKVQELVGKITQ